MSTIKIVTTLKAIKLIKNGCQGYIAQVIDTIKEEAEVRDIPL